jgi:hypothetical protein
MPKARCPVTARGAEIADYFGTIQFRHVGFPRMGKYTRYDGKAGRDVYPQCRVNSQSPARGAPA